MLSFISRLQDFTLPHDDATEKRATVVVNLSALSGKHGGEARVSEFSKWKFSLCQFFSLQVNLNF